MTQYKYAPGDAEVRRMVPVRWWAALGMAFVALQAYVFGAWMESGPSRVDAGATEPEGYMRIGFFFMNVGVPLGAAYVLVRYVVLPWRRAGRITSEGIFAFALLSVAWQDPLANYVQVVSTYNANLWSFGSWGPHVPGWMSPTGGNIAEPITAFWGSYFVMAFLIVLATDRLMRHSRSRWPQAGVAGLLAMCYGFNLLLSLASELGALRIGLYSYGGAKPGLTLFAGHFYQLPLYETVLNTFLLGTFAAIHHFRDDGGRTLVERGADGTGRATPWLRWLALAGALNAVFMAYNLGWGWFAMNQHEWVDDVVERSYFVDDVCGPSTDYACPGEQVPIPHGGSGHLGPDGQYRQPGTGG